MARNARASGHPATSKRVCGVRYAVKVFPVRERRWTPSFHRPFTYGYGYGYEDHRPTVEPDRVEYAL